MQPHLYRILKHVAVWVDNRFIVPWTASGMTDPLHRCDSVFKRAQAGAQ